MTREKTFITRRVFNKAATATMLSVAGILAAIPKLELSAANKTRASKSGFYDFTGGVLPRGVRYARNGAATYWDHRGLLHRAEADAPRFEYDPNTGQILGLLHETAARNRVTSGRNLGSLAWFPADIVTARAPTPWDAVAGEGTILYARKDNAIILASKTLGLAEYTFSAWVRRTAGWGRVDVTLDGGVTWTEISASLMEGVWTRVVKTETISTPSIGFRLGRKGDELEVDVCQLEKGSFATSELPTGKETWKRSADQLWIPCGSGLEWEFQWPPAARISEEHHIQGIAIEQIAGAAYDITITTPNGVYTLASQNLASELV